MIRMVGKPLFQRYTGTYWGAWLKDPKPADYHWAAKHWFTRHFTGKLLYEYRNLEDFRQDRISKTYELKELYFGTGHVVYKGSFYYHRTGYNEIVRYDLHKQQTVVKMELENALYKVLYTIVAEIVIQVKAGGRLNKKDGLTRYGDSHVKDKTS